MLVDFVLVFSFWFSNEVECIGDGIICEIIMLWFSVLSDFVNVKLVLLDSVVICVIVFCLLSVLIMVCVVVFG